MFSRNYEVGSMGVGAGLCMCDVVIKKFISHHLLMSFLFISVWKLLPAGLPAAQAQWPVFNLLSGRFLANVNSCSSSLYAITRPSVVCLLSVCNARAPYSAGWNFRQYFYGVWYLGHPLTSTENFTKIVPGEPHRQGVKHKRQRGSQI